MNQQTLVAKYNKEQADKTKFLKLGFLFSSVSLLISLIIIASLLPLKERVPFLVSFDENKEIVRDVKVVGDVTVLEQNQLLRNYLVRNYVEKFETYDYYLIDSNVKYIYYQSYSDIYKLYDEVVHSASNSLVKTLKNSVRVKTEILSLVNDVKTEVKDVGTVYSAEVIVLKTVIDVPTTSVTTTYKEKINLSYTIDPTKELSTEEVVYNPLNFIVIKYLKSPYGN